MDFETGIPNYRPRIFGLAILVAVGVCWPVAFAMAWPGGPSAPWQDEKQVSELPSFNDHDIEFFESRIRPLLVEHCHECHSGDDPSGNLNLAFRKTAVAGGDSGPAIVPGKPGESLLVKVIHYGDIIQMPPDSKLPNESIALLEEWIRRGAPWPSEAAGAHAGGDQKLDDWTRREQHWAWQSPKQPPVPEVANPDWTRSEIDRFLKHQMEQAGIAPAPDADRATLLRRASWLLTGILPTAGELEAFANNQDPDAFAAEVDRLLASPRFGERFARHWLDLARYAETCGHEFDYPLPHAWQYRDWLIRAFNADIPYTQFVTEHIAGDLLPNPRTNPELGYNESIIATGSWWLGEDTHGPVDVRGDEAGHIDNQIDVMSKTFLGMTVACARCHDHKFDAITTADFYAIAGMLQSSRRQEAMLDPGGRIQEAFLKREAASASLTGTLARISDGAGAGFDRDRAVSILETARALSAIRPDSTGAAVRIQGESLPVPEKPNGTVEVQRIGATGNFKWDGDQQIWWRDGELESQIVLPFSLESDGTLAIRANLTYAQDYGIFSVWIDDQIVAENLDFYSAKLETRAAELGSHKLAAGKHSLKIRATGANENAVKRQMFGLDWIEFTPSADPVAVLAWEEGLKTAFDKTGIAPDRMTALIDSLPDVIRWLDWEPANVPVEASPDRRIYHDFSSGDAGWFRTGWAFAPVADSEVCQLNQTILPGGISSSARYGNDMQGVLRSPTFEITDPKIHMLVRGGNVRVRVIVDGYVLDTSNPLLFAGMTRDLGMSEGYRWETIADDLKTYIGHRAYLEFIDQGDGWIEIAQIWFGESEPPEGLLPPNAPKDLTGLEPEKFVDSIQNSVRGSVGPGTTFPARLRNAELRKWLTLGEGRVAAGDPHGFDPASLAAASGAEKVPAPMLVQAMAEGTSENEFLFIRGNHKNLGPEVPRRSLSVLAPHSPVDWSHVEGSGRLQLAQEMTAPDHPLVPRVIVNRVWHHLFGRGLVEPTDNFGIMGSSPTHPELLDWLARDFVENGTSIKRLIRQILLSHAWQLTVTSDRATIEKDPQNRLYARVEPRRMDGEAIRDSMLAISGELKDQLYGSPVPVHLTQFMEGRGRPGKSGPLDGDGRRTIYLEVRRNFLHPMMLAFDTPIPFNAMGSRNVSNVPAQSLILMNDPFVVDQSAKWARRLVESVVDQNERLDQAFLAAIGRAPSTRERAECETMLDELMQADVSRAGAEADSGGSSGQMVEPMNEQQAWAALCHVLWNSKSFVFVW